MLEAASQVDTVVFDKTGTLTQGRPCLQQVLPTPGSGLTPDELLAYAAAVERCTSHPVAQAIVQAADQSGDFPLLCLLCLLCLLLCPSAVTSCCVLHPLKL